MAMQPLAKLLWTVVLSKSSLGWLSPPKTNVCILWIWVLFLSSSKQCQSTEGTLSIAGMLILSAQ